MLDATWKLIDSTIPRDQPIGSVFGVEVILTDLPILVLECRAQNVRGEDGIVNVRICFILLSGLFSGCVLVEVGVTNPVPSMSAIAVAPFFNLSQEKEVDGRRFAVAYFAELQKVPGFEVVPVGVTEQAIFDNDLEMNDPQDVLELTRILDVDAIAIGAITDYDPYYPPRVGLKVAWYSREQWSFHPGIPIGSDAPMFSSRTSETHQTLKHRCHKRTCCRRISSVRGQSPTDNEFLVEWQPVDSPDPIMVKQTAASPTSVQPTDSQVELDETRPIPSESPSVLHAPAADVSTPAEPSGRQANELWQEHGSTAVIADPQTPIVADRQTTAVADSQTEAVTGSQTPDDDTHVPIGPSPGLSRETQHRSLRPIMSYARIFDGSDANLVARLRDYVELNGDRRSGGWEAYLHRSEDFIRFTSHLMIFEMLTLHGGEGKRRFVFKPRKSR